MEKRDLTRGSILGNIMTFSLPYMLSYFLQMLYGLADMFVIGQYCGVDSITAVSNGAQVMHLFTVVIIGIAMGTTVLTARAVGAHDAKRMSRIIGNSITMFVVLALVFAAVSLCFMCDMVRVIDTPVEAVAETGQYLLVCFLGIPFVVAYNVIASIFRGLGDSKRPMYFVAVACVANILLDYVFIGNCGLGAIGAALGTTLSQMISVMISIIAIMRHKSLLNVSRSDLKPSVRVVKNLLKIGVPVSLQDGFIQVAFIAITVIANGRGLNDAAAVGIVEKFIGLVFVVPSSMLSSVSAISAQNFGAGLIGRAQQTMKTAMAISFIYGIVVAVVLQFVPQFAVSIFTGDADVVMLGGEYLRGYSWDCALAGVHFCFSGFFVACGYSVISFCHNFLSIVCARIPLSYMASEMYPDTLFPMGLASPAGSLLSVVICTAAYWWLVKHNKFS